MADADTESLPHYDVEVTPISSQPEIKYELLKKATVDALNKFQTDCSANLPAEFTNYLDALMGEIDSTHKAHEMHVEKASVTTSTDTSGINPNKRKLHNCGNTCYMNSVLQLIYSMDAIKDKVLNENINNSDAFKALKAYLSQMEKGVSDATQLATNLYNSVGGFKNSEFNKQEDSSEFLQKLIHSQSTIFENIKFDTIDSVHTTNSTDSTNKEACRASTKVTKHESYSQLPNDIKDAILYIPPGTPQPGYIYTLPIPTNDISFNKIDLRNVTKIPTSNKTEFLENDGCKSIDRKTISTQSVIIPGNKQQYFIVSLNRYDNGAKISTPIDLTNAEITFDNSTKFKIKGCICHHGKGPQDGHYTYVEFNDGKPTTVYDDDKDILQYDNYIKSNKGNTVDVTGYVLLFEKQK